MKLITDKGIFEITGTGKNMFGQTLYYFVDQHGKKQCHDEATINMNNWTILGEP